MKNPYTILFDRISRPKWPTHSLELLVEIKKGETTGSVLIPVPISITQHTIDFNPSLLVKATKEVKEMPLNEKFTFHPETEELLLKPEEKLKSYQEAPRCEHCNQHLVIAEVGEKTRMPWSKGPKPISLKSHYNVDPVIEVKLSDPAPQDITIPVKVGIFVGEIKYAFQNSMYLLAVALLGTGSVIALLLSGNPEAVSSLQPSAPMIALVLGFLWVFYMPYKFWDSMKKYRWYLSIKNQLVPV